MKKTAPAVVHVPQATGKGRPLVENTNALVFGKKGFGKSTWVEEVLTANLPRVVFVDTLLKDYTRGTIFTNFAEFQAAMTRVHSTGNFRFIVRCPGFESLVFELFRFNNRLGRALIQNAALVVEEVTTYCDSNYIAPAILSHLQYGRHAGNALIGVARGPFEINRHLTRQADLIVSFRQDEERDLEFFRKIAGTKAEQLRTLERGQALLMRGTSEELETFIRQGK